MSVGSEAQSALLADLESAVVHSCFDKTINIMISPDRLVSVVDQSVGSGPFNIVVSVPKEASLDRIGIRSGDNVSSKKGSLLIGESVAVNTREARLYRSNHKFQDVLQISEIGRNVDRLKGLVVSFGRSQALEILLKDRMVPLRGPNGLFARSIVDGTRSLTASIESGDLEGVKIASSSLIGLGPGLTPAADDLLCGLMTSLLLFTENLFGDVEAVRRVNDSILEASAQTTTLSRSFLRQAAVGDGNLRLVAVIEALLTSFRSETLERVTALLMDTGASSGTDAAIGVALGSSLALGMLTSDVNLGN